ncbi:unnamed protein product [Blepharisma stoltei]|uniref:Uncharacterized protein n=1 Tax=Blepharisma stoltei TaxID=1481888 RepID=A0AAU9II14_9CILI|nr:unnamed protein product [Blepharisma stoltei]
MTEETKHTKGIIRLNAFLWEEISTLGPIPTRRSNHTAICWRDSLLIFGGKNLSDGQFNDLWLFRIKPHSPDEERWIKLGIVNGPPPICRHSVVLYNQCMYTFGGIINDESCNSLYVLNFESMQWNLLVTLNSPNPIDSHTACLFNNQMIIFGGFIQGNRVNDLYVLNIDTLEWTKKHNRNSPSPRSNHSACIHSDFMYIFGGFDDEFYSDLWRLDLHTYEWFPVTPKNDPPIGRSGHSAVVYKNRILIFGGMKDVGHETNELFCYDIIKNKWLLLCEEDNSEEMSRISYAASVFPRRRSKLVKKRNSSNDRSDTKPSLFSSSSWGGYNAKFGRKGCAAPPARDGHTAVIMDEQMYIFGGDRHQISFNDLYVLALGS